MGRKVAVEPGERCRVAQRFGFNDRNLAHSWLARDPDFPRPLIRLAICNIWLLSEIETWAGRLGHGRWDEMPPGMPAERLVPLRAWAARYGVPAAGLTELSAEGLPPLAKKGGRFYLEPVFAAAVWAEHEERMARHRVAPGRRRR